MDMMDKYTVKVLGRKFIVNGDNALETFNAVQELTKKFQEKKDEIRVEYLNMILTAERNPQRISELKAQMDEDIFAEEAKMKSEIQKIELEAVMEEYENFLDEFYSRVDEIVREYQDECDSEYI